MRQGFGLSVPLVYGAIVDLTSHAELDPGQVSVDT
jgi:hypothetical protein